MTERSAQGVDKSHTEGMTGQEIGLDGKIRMVVESPDGEHRDYMVVLRHAPFFEPHETASLTSQ